MTRRGLLLGGAGAVAAAAAGAAGLGWAVETGRVRGRTFLYAHLGLDGSDGVLPHVRPGPMVGGTFVSKERRGTRVGWSIAYPPGHRPGDRLPVAVALHGASGDHTTVFDHALGMQLFLAAAVRRGLRAYAIASVDGANLYWHPRADGEDPSGMVISELLPLLARRGLRTDRIGLMGWSMGGYGALYVASLLGPRRVAAVSVLSPALYTSYAATFPGSFDSAADWRKHGVVSHPGRLRGIPLRIDCGEGDPFYFAVRDFRASLHPPAAGGFEAGAHTVGYWRRMAPEQVAFVGRHLAHNRA